MKLDDMKYMAVSLPEDVQKAKDCGDFAYAEKMIGKHLRFSDHLAMHKRLELEKEVIRRLQNEYPYSFEDALKLIQEEIPDFTEEDLMEYRDCGGADWIYINGKPYFQDRFYASMKKVYPEIARRAGLPAADYHMLNENMAYMKQHGQSRWHFQIQTSIAVRDDLFQAGEILVHMPLPAACLNMENIQVNTYTDGGIIDDENSLSRTIAFKEEMNQNHPFTVTYEYDSVVKYNDAWNGNGTGVGENNEQYLCEEYPQIRFTPAIRALCNELKGTETDPLKIAKSFYRYCTESVRYSFMRSYLTIENIPEYVADQRIGDCGVMALLFITLCRCAGIPAKWQSGMYISEERVGNHDWAMFYVEPYGWLFADPSFGNAAYHAGDIGRQQFYFGNLDPFRMAANNGFMQEFHVAKTQMRNDPYDNQSGEIEYVDQWGLYADERVTDRTLLQAKKLED